MRSQISRRRVLGLALLAAGAPLVAACGGAAAPTAAPPGASPAPAKSESKPAAADASAAKPATE